MLSECEEYAVASGLSSCDHDFFSRAATVGEPFLCRGLLCYFDGTRVEIIGYPLTPLPDDELQRRVIAVIDEWRQRTAVAVIDYIGPVPVEMSGGDEWPCAYSADPFDSNIEVFVDLTRPVIDRTKVRQDVRRARRRGIETTVVSRPMLGHEHISLLESLVRRDDFTLEDIGTTTSVVSILRHPATLSFEARYDSRLVGFIIAHRYFPDVSLAVCAAFRHESRGTSDVLYATMLEHYQAVGARRLGLGYATGECLLNYKTKWGTPILGRPFFQRAWARIPLPECDHWPWRLQQPILEYSCLATA